MRVSVEVYLLTNFWMNLLCTAVIARFLGRVRFGRVLLAAAVGAVYALLAAQTPRFWGSLPALAAAMLVVSCVALGTESVRLVLTGALSLLAGSVFLGGAQLGAARLFHGAPAAIFLPGAAVGALCLWAATALRRRRAVTWEVRVFLSAGGGEARFRALIDTGNRLREPISGLPVLICERAVLSDVLPPDYDQQAAAGVPRAFRQVGYGALGGGGRLNCFRPELCLVDYGNGFLKSPELWVAVYPGTMPGGVRALAPPVVAAAQTSRARGRAKLSM